MFTPLIRLILSIFSFIYGGYRIYHSFQDIEGWLFLFAGTALIWGHFRYGTIWRAWKFYMKNDLTGLEKQLSYIKNPELLNPQNKAYYHLLNGVILSRDEKWEEAFKDFKIASKGPLRTENALSIVYVCLADSAIFLNDKASAKEYLQKARELEHNEGVLKVIQEVEQKIGTEV